MNKLAPVLMLEDDALMQTRLKCLLLELGYESHEIHICGTVAEALQASNPATSLWHWLIWACPMAVASA
jgi:hypothetical protein